MILNGEIRDEEKKQNGPILRLADEERRRGKETEDRSTNKPTY